MTTAKPFRIELRNTFHTAELYDDNGMSIYDVDGAVAAASKQYPGDWQSVFNGQEAGYPPEDEISVNEQIVRLLESLIHQLGTDSDLESVSNPGAYRALECMARELLIRIDPTHPVNRT